MTTKKESKDTDRKNEKVEYTSNDLLELIRKENEKVVNSGICDDISVIHLWRPHQFVEIKDYEHINDLILNVQKQIEILEVEILSRMENTFCDEKTGEESIREDTVKPLCELTTEEIQQLTGGWKCPLHSCPIRADIRQFDFTSLIKFQKNTSNGKLFDVIMMDPPWQLACANPTRGVAIGYEQLKDDIIGELPIPQLQTDGFLFLWVINRKYRFALELIHKWGYKIVNDIAWVKSTVNGKIARGNGYWLQHAKETCFVCFKGNLPVTTRQGMCSDVIFAQRRGQSQKPTEIYEYIETLVPNGYYLEIFGRRNNLRNYWVTIGNEI